ncbi:amidohydrolase [Arthrobacter sp. MYb211]|nr:amidohydrolase [Arthrobacter sp. MYb221]PRC06274.1 amidohydrolase [Arthrobacter sp. MYb211]
MTKSYDILLGVVTRVTWHAGNWKKGGPMADELAQLVIHSGVVPGIGLAADIDAAHCDGRPSAVAVRDGRIIAIGDEDLLRLAGPETTVIDARGGAILPGLNDGHLHFSASAMIRHAHLSVATAANWTEVAKLLDTAKPDASGWIRAASWDEVRLGSVDSELLLEANSRWPVVAFDTTGHQLLVNAVGLKILGLERIDEPVPGGVIGRLADGSPSGLFGDAAMQLVNDGLPSFTEDQLRTAFIKHQQELHSLGITSLTEPGLGPGGRTLMAASCGTQSLEILADLAHEGLLSLRLNCLLLFSGTGGESLAAVRSGLAGDLPTIAKGIDPLRLRIAGVKVFADGIPRSGTSWFHDEYQLPCGHGHGALVLRGNSDAEKVAEFRQIISEIDAAGLQAGVHVTGDAATEALIEAVEQLDVEAGPRGNRHYIIHGAFRDPELLDRVQRAGMGYSTNPKIRAEAGTLIRRLLGPDRFTMQQPLATAALRGVAASLASDAPVTNPDWRNSIISAVTRDTSAGPGADDSERISLAQALAMMTQTPAWQDHAEQDKGSIKVGQVADFCILRDPLSTDIQQLAQNPTTHTIVDGDVVYRLNSLN